METVNKVTGAWHQHKQWTNIELVIWPELVQGVTSVRVVRYPYLEMVVLEIRTSKTWIRHHWGSTKSWKMDPMSIYVKQGIHVQADSFQEHTLPWKECLILWGPGGGEAPLYQRDIVSEIYSIHPSIPGHQHSHPNMAATGSQVTCGPFY